ncbi:ATP-binding protein [Solidesulfovibrio sp.]|mgnify:CR=1 FL=1|uniref:ATP-binding protein n=1 Tax=Solidesulfovibrio sp. TaxID=2910990 RepID=UPI000EB92816|nr:ATP-binding protein [Solidesulfovibrio sp.]MEA5090189.1 ATP-binding protein [Solidesulfovibrio sp.]HCR13756.1 hybrid sensor histidine kinase/response regulator [Desulfovibrio sp.]HML59847.1 ATP-binding protein [Solidesulfovibrio sp.]
MKWPRLQSLQVRITLLVLLALTPAIILHIVSAMEKRAMALTTAADNLRIVTELAATNIGKLLQSSGEMLSGLVLLPEIRSMQPEAARTLLAKAKEVFPGIASIALLDPQGNVVASTLPDTPGANYADRPWVRAAKAGSPLGIGAFAKGKRTGLPGIALASPVRGDSGEILGVCTIALRLPVLMHVMADAHMPRQSQTDLFDDTGLVLANWPENPQRIGQPLPNAIQILAEHERAPQATVTGPGPDGSPFFSSMADVQFGGEKPLHLRVGQPKALAEAPLAALLFQDMVIFAVTLALALFAARLFGRTFLLLPAGKLARMAKAMAVGDLDRRCDMGGGHGELSDLGAALDTMAETLRERIRFTQEIIDAIPAPLFYKDLEGRIVGVNKTYETDIRPLALVKGKTSREIDAPEMAARCEATDREVLHSPSRSVQFETTLRLIDGLDHEFLIFKSAYYSAAGAPAGIVGVCLDITTRNRSEKALAASEMRYRSLVTSMRDGFAVIDRKDRIVETNPAFREMLGYTEAELAGMTYRDITPPEWHEQEEAILRDVVDAHGFSPIFEKEYRRKDGTPLSVAIRVHRYPGAPEDERRYFAVARDVTATKAIEADLRLAKEEAERANRAKSDFLAKMSHDIRTPLNAVIGMTDLTLGSELAPAQRDALETARESAGILLDLISDILDISKIEARKLELASEPFDLRRTLAATVRAMRPQAARKGLALHLAVAPDVPRFVRGDQIRLRQILVNLVGNAVKFTQAGGVSVSLRRLAAATAENAAQLAFAVADTGIGIAPARLGRIFDMFTQADATVSRRYGGTGLGLAICRELARLMGGNIAAESAPGRGSTFRFTLPLPEAQPVAHGAEPPAAAGLILPAETPLRILLAEDNPVNVKVAATYLGRRGHTFVVAQNGREALDLLARQPFDVIFMDLEMPECDGFEATRRLRAGEAGPMNRSRPVIAMTAHALSGVRQRCLEAGMTDYLAKPLDFQALGVLLGGIAVSGKPETADAAQDAVPDLDTAAALQRLGGDTELLRELESDFLRQYPQKLRRIILCRDSENWDEAALAAHSLKNIVGAIGAEAARRLAGDLEESLRRSDSDTAERLFGTIKESLRRAEAALGDRAASQPDANAP